MLTERDEDILQFINQFGFCEMPHIAQQFNFISNRKYKVMKKLIREGYVIYESTKRSQHGLYRLTEKGASETNLPPLRHVPFGIYKHEILLIQLYFKLMTKYPDAIWVSERHLKYQKFQEGIGKKGHVPDGIMSFTESKKTIAIELERRLKAKPILEKILRSYRTETEVDEIWYFCEDEVLPTLTSLAAERVYLKVYRLKEFLYAPA